MGITCVYFILSDEKETALNIYEEFSKIKETNMKLAIFGLACLVLVSAVPVEKRGAITDLAQQIQGLIDGIDHVLHPDATVTKRDLVDIAHQIEGVIGEISKVLGPSAKRGVITDLATTIQGVIDGIDHVLHPDAVVTKRDLVDIAHQIEGVIGELGKVLTPTTKRGVITDLATTIQGVIDGIDHVLPPDAVVTKRDLV